MKYFDSVTDLIGNTPLVKINKLNNGNNNIFAKLEYLNPSGSVKDRAALNMIEKGFESGEINQKTTIIEPTSGNTGIGLALVCAIKQLNLIIIMPESMSLERKKIIKSYGAKLILTPKNEGMSGAINKAKLLRSNIQDSIILNQFSNTANSDIHRQTTALEIWNDLEGKVDIVVACVGTGGTITGIGEILKIKNPSIKIIAVEPTKSAVLSGEKPGIHKIQGIGAGFIPDILNVDIIDEIIKVDVQDAINTARDMAKKEGLFAGFSSGAAVFASLKIAKKYSSKNIVVILPSNGERYLSTELYENF